MESQPVCSAVWRRPASFFGFDLNNSVLICFEFFACCEHARSGASYEVPLSPFAGKTA